MRDPARPRARLDVLVLGPEEPRPRPFSRGRLGWAAALLVAAGLLATGVVEVRERRAIEAAERRLASVVDLAVVPGGGADVASGGSGSPGRITLQQVLRLRNDGPRALTVLSGGIAEHGVAREVTLRPTSITGVLLERSVVCSADDPPRSAVDPTLRLVLATGAGQRQVELTLPRPFVDDRARAACGLLPLSESIELQAAGADQRPRSLQLSVEVRTRSIRPVEVTGARARDRGLDAVLEEARAGPVGLPVPGAGGQGVATLTVVLTVADCVAARSAVESFSLPGLVLIVTSGREQAQPAVDYAPVLLAELVDGSCGSRAS